jgi:hypothetical protein
MSNDLKYVLLPTIGTRRREPKFQPWYLFLLSIQLIGFEKSYFKIKTLGQ